MVQVVKRERSGMLRNNLVESLSSEDRALIVPLFQEVSLARGDILFEPGEEVSNVYFPAQPTVGALIVSLDDGATAEAAMIGVEGALGGIVSAGHKPAFTRGVAHIAGPALRLKTDDLEAAKAQSVTLRDHFARYADCLLAQLMQSVVCNAVHDMEPRLARWLLAAQDRTGAPELHLTQDFIAEMLGAQRSYVTRIIGQLERKGVISGAGRGIIVVTDRPGLEEQSCECYAKLRAHFEDMLPGVYP